MACTHRLFFSKQYLTPNARLPDVARLTFTRKRNAGKFSTDTSRYHHKLAIGDRIICKAANSKSVAQRDCWIASGCIEVTADLVELGQSTCSDGQLNTARKHYDIRKLHALSVVTGLSLSLSLSLQATTGSQFRVQDTYPRRGSLELAMKCYGI